MGFELVSLSLQAIMLPIEPTLLVLPAFEVIKHPKVKPKHKNILGIVIAWFHNIISGQFQGLPLK